MADSLKQKTVSGVIWSAIQKFGSIFLSFVSNIVLARLLTPDDYGCIGMLAIFMALSTTFIDGGFGSALIQKKRPTKEDYSTIFYWNIFLGIILYLVLFFFAPLIAKFYKIDLLCPVLRVQGIILIINALKIIPYNQLRKQFEFKKIATVEVTVSAISLALTIFLAWKGFGVWALVFQQITFSTLSALVYWCISKWKPLLVFSKQSFKELFGFGGYVLLSNLINTFCNNIQGLLIGRLYNPATMGFYSKAKTTEELSSTFISSIMDQVTYPALVEAQNDNELMKRMLKKFICVLAYVTFPLMLLLILLAKPLFVLLYSERWLPSVPYFQILCIAGLFICLQGINYYAVAAVGKSDSLFKGTLLKRSIGLILIIGGLVLFGIKGLLVGMVLGSFSIYFINAYLVSKHVGYKLVQQFCDLLPIIALAGLSFCISYILCHNLNCNMYLVGLIELVVFSVIYLIGSWFFKLSSFIALKEIVSSLFGRLLNKDNA